MRAPRVLSLGVLILARMAGTAFADAGCGPVSQALDALVHAPAYHLRMEIAPGDRTTVTMERIVNGDGMYMKPPNANAWYKVPLSPETRRKMDEQLSVNRPVHDCRQVGTALVNGMRTTVHQYVQKTTVAKGAELADFDVTKKIYVGEKDGRVYRIDSRSSQQPVTMFVDYTNVSTPVQ